MACTVRSVSPTAVLMSRIRASGSRAISTSTCPCPVSRVQLPPGSLIPRDHILARELTREETREIFLAFLLTGFWLVPILVVLPERGAATGGDAGAGRRLPRRAGRGRAGGGGARGGRHHQRRGAAGGAGPGGRERERDAGGRPDPHAVLRLVRDPRAGGRAQTGPGRGRPGAAGGLRRGGAP